MTRCTALIALPALVCTLLAPALAHATLVENESATGPEDGLDESPALEAAPEVEAEAVVVSAPAEAAPIEPELLAEAASADADYIEPEPYEDPYLDYDYEPKRTTMELDSGYIALGIAPGMTFHPKGFHPNTRFELEFGGTLEHSHRDLALSFGVATHITPYYERKAPSFGADVTATAVLGPIYLRTGLGALGGLPRQHLLHETAAGIGGVVGAGLTFGRAPMIRVGVDYDLRVNTKLEPVHTVFLAVRLVCCRSD